MGDAGTGKTTIAFSCFPQPLFIPIERGLLSVPDADAIQQPQNTGEVKVFLQGIRDAAIAGTLPYKTIVLDSVSEFETMAVREVCAAHGVATLGTLRGSGRRAIMRSVAFIARSAKFATRSSSWDCI